MQKIKAGDFVIIKHLKQGAQVLSVDPENESARVKIALINPYSGETSISTDVFPLQELKKINQKKGLLIIN